MILDTFYIFLTLPYCFDQTLPRNGPKSALMMFSFNPFAVDSTDYNVISPPSTFIFGNMIYLLGNMNYLGNMIDDIRVTPKSVWLSPSLS
jgi:hypothetical protein